LDHFMN